MSQSKRGRGNESAGHGVGGVGVGGSGAELCSSPLGAVIDQAKRLRISKSPGEIRLSKDILEIVKQEYFPIPVIMTPGELPTQLFLSFEGGGGGGGVGYSACYSESIPSEFHITVDRYYPHHPPIVTCLDANYRRDMYFIDIDGSVRHPCLLEENWSALMTLSNVVQWLQELRMCCGSDAGASAGMGMGMGVGMGEGESVPVLMTSFDSSSAATMPMSMSMPMSMPMPMQVEVQEKAEHLDSYLDFTTMDECEGESDVEDEDDDDFEMK